MEKFLVNLCLKNGREYSYWAFSKAGKKVIFNDITNKADGRWYEFIDINTTRQYWVDRNEIASIGISLTNNEIQNYENEINEKEKT